MAEQATPNDDQRSVQLDHDRESASRQPGGQSPSGTRQPHERTSEPDLGESDAARRQARQDPLQRRDR
jgi:hypothetical protein